VTVLVPRMEILPAQQREIWPLLKPTVALGFVLYGGTAVALRLGHRQSIDFDFFIEQNLEIDELFEAMPFLRAATVIQQEPKALTVLSSMAGPDDRPVKISFFGPVRTGRVGVPELTDDGIMVVASPGDLFATKVKVLLQRIEAKDYRDIAAMIASGHDLARALGGARAMFGPSFQPSESLKAMTYFEGGDLRQLSYQDRQLLIEAVKAVKAIPEVDILDGRLSIRRLD
jgi:hypothetical protein